MEHCETIIAEPTQCVALIPKLVAVIFDYVNYNLTLIFLINSGLIMALNFQSFYPHMT